MMSFLSLLSVTALYTLSLVGDGCVVVALALAATVGGRPWLWGVSFASFHALYASIGVVVAAELVRYSDLLGDLLVLIGSLVLLRHFMHHRIHHIVQKDCSCEHHHHSQMSSWGILSTAGALSIHSLAGGAIVRELVGPVSTLTLTSILLLSSVLVGALIATIVFLGETERAPILKKLDKIPGVFAALLTGVCCWALYHTLHEFLSTSWVVNALYVVASIAISVTLGYITHERGSSALVQIPSRRG
jgi:hypothetical protein